MHCLHDGEALTAEMAAWAIVTDADGFQSGRPHSCHKCGRFYSVGEHEDGRLRVTELPPYKEPQPEPPRGSFDKIDETAKGYDRRFSGLPADRPGEMP